MPSRALPARPHLDHLKHEAKALRSAFLRGEPAEVVRVQAVLGPRTELKLTEAQRVIAREYGFKSWPQLRAHVQAARGVGEAVDAFLAAVAAGDREGAANVLRTEPRIATASLHVAAVLGREADVRRLVAADPPQVAHRAGAFGGEPVLWLCHSPFHGESPERDEGLAASARALLDAGADPNTRDRRYGVPALYAVTGLYESLPIARMLLDAGAEPTDGESLFHAAERFHERSLELLLAYGADPNVTGEWGNTPLYFLLRYWDVEQSPRVKQGLLWLLDHGADPAVPSGEERENSLHVAVRRGQHPDIVRLLLERGVDVNAPRGDGRTAWLLARRGGHDQLVSLLEQAGAEPEPLSRTDELMMACARGEVDDARRLASPDLIAALAPADLRSLPEAAARGAAGTVRACLAAGFPIDTTDEQGATALHHAAIHGRALLTRELLGHGAPLHIRDREHDSPPLGWACFGADYVADTDGDYVGTVRALLDAGASPAGQRAAHRGVREALGLEARE